MVKIELKDALTKNKVKKIVIDEKKIPYYSVKDVHRAIEILCHRFNYLFRDGEKEPWRPKTEKELTGIFDEIHNSFPVILEICPKCSSVIDTGVKGDVPIKFCIECNWEEEIPT